VFVAAAANMLYVADNFKKKYF